MLHKTFKKEMMRSGGKVPTVMHKYLVTQEEWDDILTFLNDHSEEKQMKELVYSLHRTRLPYRRQYKDDPVAANGEDISFLLFPETAAYFHEHCLKALYPGLSL